MQYGSWICQSKIHKAGFQEGQDETLKHSLKLQSQGRIYSSGMPLVYSCLLLQLIESGPPRLSRIIAFA